jgi:hypothetical protein
MSVGLFYIFQFCAFAYSVITLKPFYWQNCFLCYIGKVMTQFFQIFANKSDSCVWCLNKSDASHRDYTVCLWRQNVRISTEVCRHVTVLVFPYFDDVRIPICVILCWRYPHIFCLILQAGNVIENYMTARCLCPLPIFLLYSLLFFITKDPPPPLKICIIVGITVNLC